MLKFEINSLWNLAHVRRGTEGKASRYCLHVRDDFFLVAYCGRLWLSCFHACETRQNHSTKAIQARVTSFVCTGRNEGRCTLRGPKAGGDTVMLYRFCCNNCHGNNRVEALVLYVIRGLKISSSFFPHSTAPSQCQFRHKWYWNKKKKKYKIDLLQSLHTWCEIWEFLLAMRQFLFSVSVMLGVGFVCVDYSWKASDVSFWPQSTGLF